MFGFLKKLLKKKSATQIEDRSVLVGIVKDAQQYKINLANNFYHIPAKRIYTLDLPIKYVALFKSDRIFPENESGVYVYGKVKKCTTVKRYEIAEKPKSSDEEYLRLDVEKWICFDHPIKTGEISKTHMFTSLGILLNAKSVPELYMTDEEAVKFFRFLEQECNKASSEQVRGCTYNGIKVAFTKEYIEVVYPNTFHTKYRRTSYYKKPYALFCAIMNK